MANTHARVHVRGPQPITECRTRNLSFDHLDIKDQSLDSNAENATTTAVQSRREKRKQRKQKDSAPSPTSSTPSTNPSSDTDTNTNTVSAPKLAKQKIITISALLIPTMPPGPQTIYPLLVCSLGNPGPTYANTLHSAGHTVLSEIQSRGLYAPFTKGLSGLVSRPNTARYKLSLTGGYQKTSDVGLVDGEDDFVLWQSTTLMNISGSSVRKAWMKFNQEVRERGMQGRLVVVHDELEAALGKVSVKDGGASPRGHNGLKSCQASLGGIKWWRVGVGIGRPESREPSVVAKYVLSKMDRKEQASVENSAYGVLGALREIQEGKK